MVITQQESTALKGLCIVSIVMHNVLHLLTAAKENEFTFSADNVTFFLDNFRDSPLSYAFSFYGWLGVSFFIFISGYGLSVKYGCNDVLSQKWIKQHYLKLVLLLFPAFLVSLSLTLYKYPNQGIVDYGYFILEQALLLNIVNPHVIQPGVFWYIGIAFQFYIWFIWLRKLSNKSLILIGLSFCLFMVFLPMNYISYIRHNSFGWMLEFVFGMLLARYGNFMRGKHLRYVIFVLCLLLTILFSLSRYTFFLSGICFIGMLLIFRKQIARIGILLYLGGLSACIYVIHPVIRQVWLNSILLSCIKLPPPIIASMILLISIGVSILYNQIYVKSYKKWI